MPYVIAEPCIGVKDTACVDACPADAIHPRADEADFSSVNQLYIHPIDCIDCGACVPRIGNFPKRRPSRGVVSLRAGQRGLVREAAATSRRSGRRGVATANAKLRNTRYLPFVAFRREIGVKGARNLR